MPCKSHEAYSQPHLLDSMLLPLSAWVKNLKAEDIYFMNEIKTDVLIIGAGGAGLRAAIEAHDAGAEVLVLSKSILGKAHTVMAEGGIAVALANNSQDSWEAHFKDTMIEGQLINNWKMVKLLAQEVPERIKELEEWGAIFDRDENGKIAQRAFGAHTYKRVSYVGDRTGLEIIRTLQDQVIARNINVIDETFVTKIISTNKACGAIAVDLKEGVPFIIYAKAIIIATGGVGRVYKTTSNSWETCGDGVALAFDIGAELQDMEMIQFHPTGMVYPKSAAGLLVTEAVRGEGGILLNAKGERFMTKYDAKRMELSARDVVARAIYNEIKNGNATEHGAVWLDITHKGSDYIMEKLPSMYQQYKDFANVNITKEKMEVAPTAHYTMGGIRTNENCETSVAGLFVTGEAAAGVHGANRLGGNSLADILVFGKHAGASAAAYAKKQSHQKINEKEIENEIKRIENPLKENGENTAKVEERIQEIMWKNVGIARNKKDLQNALDEISKIKKIKLAVKGSLTYNQGWLEAMCIPAMITICEAIIKSALAREESRGAHFRDDFPKQDDKNWLKNIICKNMKGEIKIEKINVPSGYDEN